MKVGKKYAAAKQQIEPRPYTVEDAMGLLKRVHYAKFNETIEVHMRLGVDPNPTNKWWEGPSGCLTASAGRRKVVLSAPATRSKKPNERDPAFAGAMISW